LVAHTHPILTLFYHLIFQMTYTRDAFLLAISLAWAAGADVAAEPGCLLQNQFVNDKFQSAGEDMASQSFLQAKEVSRSEMSVLENARRASAQRHQQYRVHIEDLRRTLAVLNTNFSNSTNLMLFQQDPTNISSGGEEVGADDGMSDIGAGCCLNRDPATMLFKGFTAGVDLCKAKCASIEDCGFIEYGWKGNKDDGSTNWCTVISKDTDCSELADGPKDCGGGGGDNGVHTYMLLSAVEEQCQSGSLPANQFVQHGWTTIPGLKGTDVKDVFVTHGGIFNGAYVLGAGKPPDAVRRKKGTKHQWIVAVHDDKFAKLIELTFHVTGSGEVQVHQSGARYKQMSREDALAAFGSTESILNLFNTGSGQHRAQCDGCAGYGIKGLKVKSCLASESAVKAGADMGELVEDFINGQSGAEDACHSQLLEARHQLNQLHQLVLDLAQEVNSTEEQIMVYDKMLEEKLRQMSQLAKWKETELDKCETARQTATGMFAKLKGELDEMHSIANPSIAMDVKTGKLHEVSLAQEVSIHQHREFAVDATGEPEIGAHHISAAHHLHPGHHEKAAHGERALSLDKQSADATMMSGLIAETQKASDAYKACIGPNDSHISLAMLSEGKPKTNEECEAEKEALEKTYVKAYVELSRMKAEYEELANSTSCFDAINEQYNSRHPPLQDASDKISSQINIKVKALQELRPRLDGAKASESKLRAQVTKLTAQCKNVGATVSDLDKVRDAIQSLSECPGLSRVKFSMPKWVGTWATFDQDATAQDDASQDSLMNSACSKIKAGSRAAEVGEIQEQTVEGIPETNTAPNTLIGACPDCAGSDDESFQSGHGRVCWSSGAELTLGGRSTNCGAGKKAILCVEDRPDVRVIPGGGGKL